MIQHILVPIDFSDLAETAVEHAAKISKKTGATISMLHAYLIPGYTGGMAYETFIPPIDEHIELINKQIDDFEAGIPELKGIKVRKQAVPGAIKDIIGNYVEDNNVDLVISATRGASGFMGYLIGSQSERIEGEVSCPVIILPEHNVPQKGIKMALAHDYKSTVSAVQRDFLRFFLDFYDGELHIVHVEEKDDTPEAELSVRQDLEEFNPAFHKVVHKDVEKGLNEFIEKEKINMLALIYHDHNLLHRIFGRSTTRNLTYNTKIPLLVLK